MQSVLFVCIENSNRSQMAQAFASMEGVHQVIAYSAGSRPSGTINPKAIQSMQELGYDLTVHTSKSLDDLPDISFDAVVTMGCGDTCPWIPARMHIEWDIPDPRDMNAEEFRKVRDLIRDKVKSLLSSLSGPGE